MYHLLVQEITAFIVAGGKSSRMGADKAFLELGDRTLLARAIQTASSVTQDVRIVGDSAKFKLFGSVVEDIFPSRGPLAGIHAALVSSETDLNLMLAVDLPFVEAKFLEFLISIASENDAVVTVPRASGGYQPLCAVYRREFAVLAGQSLQRGKNKIDLLFGLVKSRVLEEDEWVGKGFSKEMFCNINTMEDWDRARNMLKEIQHPS
jgi:molybdopterin-guanine dinucleotide biosynthesis protein A